VLSVVCRTQAHTSWCPCTAKTRSNAGPDASSLPHAVMGAHVESMQYTKRLGLVYTRRRRSWPSRILTPSYATWMKDGLRTFRKPASTGSHTYVADIARAQAPLLTTLRSRLSSRTIRHMHRTLKVFVACGASVERQIWYLLPVKYR
jgi:hypothetical protein